MFGIAKKSGYTLCSFVLRILFLSTDQSVKVETDGNAEHVHEPDPLFGLQGGVVGRIMLRLRRLSILNLK